MKLAENMKAVPVMNTADYNAGVDADSINMKNFHHATFLCTFGAIAGDAILKVYSGASAGTKTSALTFTYAFGGAAIGTAVAGSTASCDVLAADTSAATLTLTGTAYDNDFLMVEVDASAMDVANGEEWLTLEIDDTGSGGICHIVAILEPRYSSARSATCLA